MLVQALVTHASVEAFDKAVLHWFTWRDVVPIDFAVFLPLQDRIRSQLCSIVTDHHAGISTASAQKLRPDRPKADHALTFKLDHPIGALHFTAAPKKRRPLALCFVPDMTDDNVDGSPNPTYKCRSYRA